MCWPGSVWLEEVEGTDASSAWVRGPSVVEGDAVQCVPGAMVYVSETWGMKGEDLKLVEMA